MAAWESYRAKTQPRRNRLNAVTATALSMASASRVPTMSSALTPTTSVQSERGVVDLGRSGYEEYPS
jgi:hypothetical protein